MELVYKNKITHKAHQ